MLFSPQHASGRVLKAARLESPAEAAVPCEGQPAPLFSLPDADMEMFDLASVLGSHHVVLYFYPRDNTPGCTRQAIDFSDHDADFAQEKCVVVGVSPDDCLTHADFRDQHGLSVELLSDEDGDACRLYGVWQTGQVNGVTKRSVRRSTFIISSDGVLRHVMHDVNPRGHAAEVFQLVKQLNSRNVNANRQKHGRHT
ncbi:MAG TPA: peroxiredoxin [Zoogloea sp.]|jgi:peroxiredoxin Q/BCP|uniref:peroxiredoxin n=1 Tax=Zoogloea sp. TaxID=49181 RepID=UPI001B4CBDC4|nr:peroxiredoxin [Zoogloea sp.]MBP7394598.1 peroxiredoxin [Zoogloea sp.]HOB45236.1 peroxiredoxin [Zoogloea sp.]HQA09037.1 peroxiredoxin [Zoogloea sp.]HQE38169.1 peroxiredoxin [Zoogloea sp.]